MGLTYSLERHRGIAVTTPGPACLAPVSYIREELKALINLYESLSASRRKAIASFVVTLILHSPMAASQTFIPASM